MSIKIVGLLASLLVIQFVKIIRKEKVIFFALLNPKGIPFGIPFGFNLLFK